MTNLIQNRKAYHEYTILETYTAGMILNGTEVKSLKNSNASINEAYCFISNGEIFIRGMSIQPYKEIAHTCHDPNRDKKLLLHKKEILKLHKGVTQMGNTIVPLSVFISDTGFIKINIGLGKGKVLYDKRLSEKIKTQKKEILKAINN